MASPVVTLEEVEPAIAQITLIDKANKNTFTPGIFQGLLDTFAEVGASDRFKVVILTGYDNYFATGGTQAGLMSLYEGRAKFNDTNYYALPMECPIPVVAAMNGHGIGGGFVLGLCADFVVLAREGVYTTNFMRYGFTPGMGATYLVPQKLGVALGHEMLLLARNYRGAELEQRGCPFPVVPKNQVMTHAFKTARELAEKPRQSLLVLKQHLVKDMRRQLPQTIAAEVAMHEQTIHQPEVKQRIIEAFGT